MYLPRFALMIRYALMMLAAACGLLALCPAPAQAVGIAFTFTLPHAYTTSAGVYDASGHLVKRLWSKRTYKVAGTYSDAWDGSLDTGGAAPAGNYTVKVLYHNQSYSWEGVIGNTSASLTGRNRWTLDVPICDLAATPDGTTICTANGYSEGKPSASRFAPATPQKPTHVVFDASSDGHANSAIELRYVATDGRRAYYANIGTGWSADTWASFVFATSLSDNSEFLFQNPQSWKPAPFEHTYLSVVDKTPADAGGKPTAPPTGIAVQQDPGTLLAVAHGAVGQVRLFGKTSGQPAGSFSVPNPQRMAFAPGGDLWVISGGGLQRFSGVGRAATLAASIADPSRAPLAVAVNPVNSNQVLVAWGGSSQQVKCYNRNGVKMWTLGQAGGYPVNGPAITSDKFDFFVRQNTGTTGAAAALTVLPNGTFWVGDPGNERSLHFSVKRSCLGQIAYVPLQHKVIVDPNNPARIFDETGLEFKRDYTKPLQPGDPDPAFGGNGAWARVRNWGAAARTLGDDTSFTSVVTLSNGRTYGILSFSPWPSYPSNPWDVVELTASGLRRTKAALDPVYRPDSNGNTGYLFANGDLRYRVHDSAHPDPFFVQHLTGFDPAGNPQWTGPIPIATAPVGSSLPLASGTYPLTSSGVLVLYDNGHGLGSHLGGIALGGDASGFAWTAEPGVSNNNGSQVTGSDPALDTPPDGLGGYGINAFGGLCGTSAMTSGQNVLTYYNGQGNGMDNQWAQFWDDGLFVGQWGEATHTHPRSTLDGIAGEAYNCTNPATALLGGVTYAFTSDESAHFGIHSWRLDGQTRELSGTGTLGGSVSLGTAGAWPAANLVFNPGFEAEGPTAAPAGWVSDESSPDVCTTGTFGNDAPSPPYSAQHFKNTDYSAYTYQDLANIPNGTYTLTARISSSGGQTTAQMEIKDMTTGVAAHASIGQTNGWQTVSISNWSVSNHQARIAFYSLAHGGNRLGFDSVSLLPAAASPTLQTKPKKLQRTR